MNKGYQISAVTKWLTEQKNTQNVDKFADFFYEQRHTRYESALFSQGDARDIQLSCCILNGLNPNDESKEGCLGTGFLAEWGEHRFIISNHHVLKNRDWSYVAIFPSLVGADDMFILLKHERILNKTLDIGIALYKDIP